MWNVVLDALFDTLKLFPFLFILYVLIELMEHNTGVGKPRKALTGKWAPALGAGLGIVPMCGFSVMAAKLYRHRHITLGTLLAVFITTSDEALLVLLLSNMDWAPKLCSVLALVLSKLVLGIGIGYLFDAVFRRTHGAPAPLPEVQHDHEHGRHVRGEGFEFEHEHHHDHEEEEHETGDCACDELSPCEHKHDEKWRMYLISPLLHALQVAGFVLVVNLLFGFLFFGLGNGDAAAGADRVGSFMGGTGYWLQPLFCAFVGAIPNCASSVILAEVYALGSIGFGGLLASLVVNAGLGYIVLFRRKDWKRGLCILAGMLLFGIVVGFAANAIALFI